MSKKTRGGATTHSAAEKIYKRKILAVCLEKLAMRYKWREFERNY